MQHPLPAPDCRPAASLLADERGATAIEYALVAALVAVAIVGGLTALSSGTSGLYGRLDAIATAISTALQG
jgi:pilus assembly protein Flp/PilA